MTEAKVASLSEAADWLNQFFSFLIYPGYRVIVGLFLLYLPVCSIISIIDPWFQTSHFGPAALLLDTLNVIFTSTIAVSQPFIHEGIVENNDVLQTRIFRYVKQTSKSMLFPVKNTLYLWAGASLPSWKPFLKRRVMVFRYFMRPVPCPRRRELLRAQLSTCGYISDSTILLHSNEPTVSHLSIGVTARSASALLNVEGTAVASSADGVSLGVSLTKRSGTLGLQRGYSNSKTKNTRMLK